MTKQEQELSLQHHKTAAEHHAGLAECSKAMADHHEAAGKHLELTDRVASAMHADACAQCKKMAGHHVSLAENHLGAYKAIGDLATSELQSSGGESSDVKALTAQVGDLIKFLGDSSGRVSPIPLTAAPRPTIVPRYGAADPTAVVNKVDEKLRHLVVEENETGT
jgi:hypothetical protein